MTGNWNGRDPRLRLLRTLAVAVVVFLIAWVIVAEDETNVAALGTLVGALLVLLGFEAGIRWPGKGGDEE